MTLAVEAGLALILEHRKGEPSRARWAARLAERFEYQLTASTKLWESLPAEQYPCLSVSIRG